MASTFPKESIPATMAWLDQIADVLKAEAELAGLLGHKTMIGDAREFVVERVLRTVVPPSFHFGSGVILSRNGQQSKQVDVIIYDPDFPLMETRPGQGVYFADGVVAAIEVKSSLDRTSLRGALDNCLSVTRLPVFETAQDCEYSKFTPATLVVSFRTHTAGNDTIADHVQEWIDNRCIKQAKLLPEFLVAGQHLAMANGRWFRTSISGETIMTICTPRNPMAWLLMDLLICCTSRTSDEHKLAFQEFLPIREFFQRDLASQPISNCIASAQSRVVISKSISSALLVQLKGFGASAWTNAECGSPAQWTLEAFVANPPEGWSLELYTGDVSESSSDPDEASLLVTAPLDDRNNMAPVIGSGDAGHYRVKDNFGMVVLQGLVTEDIQVANTQNHALLMHNRTCVSGGVFIFAWAQDEETD